MFALPIWHWFVLAGFLFAYLYPVGRVLRRTGYSAWWAPLYLIPFVNLIGLWTLAYVRWPGRSV